MTFISQMGKPDAAVVLPNFQLQTFPSPAVGQLVAWPCAAAQPSENGLTEEPDSLIEAPGDLGSRFSRFSSTCVFI